MSSLRLEGVSVRFPRETKIFGQGSGPVIEDSSGGQDALARLRASDDPLPAHATSQRDVLALDDVSLDVQDGETIALLGPSGCGKSTLLRVVAGLQAVAAGRVLFDEQDVTLLEPKDRGIGMVFQNYALYPHMEGKGNLGFFFKMHHREREIDEKVRVTAEILGIGFSELLERRPKQLSGGQQQRVAIGRCIVRDPRIFLFDEPLSSLDARIRATTRVEIKRLLRRFKITTLYVTHDQTEAITLGDRVAVVRAGHIEQIGTFREVYDDPVSVFVGGFIGAPAMNFQYATRGEDASQLSVADGTVRLAGPLRNPATGSRLIVGIRPEHVRLAESDRGAIHGIVEVVEPLVAERQQLVALDVAGRPFAARLPASVPVGRGDSLPLLFPPDYVRLFDVETGKAMASVPMP